MSFRVAVVEDIFVLNFDGGQRLVVFRESLTQHTTCLYCVGEDVLTAILRRYQTVEILDLKKFSKTYKVKSPSLHNSPY